MSDDDYDNLYHYPEQSQIGLIAKPTLSSSSHF